MQIVIDLSEEKWEVIQNKMYCNIFDLDMWNAIKNGIPLPKGHGRLIDGDELESRMKIGYRIVKDAKTIVEADKESE